MADKPKVLSLPLLITRSLVIFPGNQQLIEAGREFSINAINLSRNKADSLIYISSQIKPKKISIMLALCAISFLVEKEKIA